MIEQLCHSSEINVNDFNDYQYGAHLGRFSQLSEKGMVGIALLSEGEDEGPYLAFRKALYEMSANFPKFQFVDLGAVKGGAVGITEVVDYLQQRGIFSIVLSRATELPIALLRSYSATRKPLHLSLVESRLDYSWGISQGPYLADKLLPLHPETLSRLSFLGYQSYFVDPKVLELFQDKHFETHRIGNLRSNMAEVEPIVRDSDILGLNLSALSYTDAPGTRQVNPNGFSAAEACQIVRYAAMSDRLSCIGIYGYAPEEDVKNLTALLLAQMVWYMVAGFQQRKKEYPLRLEELTRYEVQLTSGQIPVSFFKSRRSERWWFYVAMHGHLHETDALDPECLVSCSYDDYLQTCEGEVPERLLNALARQGG